MKTVVSQPMQRSVALAGGFLIGATALFIAQPAEAVRLDFDEANVNLAPGEIVGSQWQADYGVTFSATDKSGNSENLLLFNSTCNPGDASLSHLPNCTGGDPDLATGKGSYKKSGSWYVNYATPDQGNVLIIHEQKNNDLLDPDDDANGGWINMNFDEAVSFDKIGFLDLDDVGIPEFKFLFADGTWSDILSFQDGDAGVKSIGSAFEAKYNSKGEIISTRNPEGENSLREYSFYLENVVEARVKLPSSGAIAYLEYNQVEVPEPLTLAGLGVAAGAMVASRRRR